MKEQLVSFEAAILAKEKGFDFYVPFCYDMNRHVNDYSFELTYPLYLSPTQSLLQKWLREEYGIQVFVDYDIWSKVGYTFKINNGQYPKDREIRLNTDVIQPFDTYENALEYALEEALKLIK